MILEAFKKSLLGVVGTIVTVTIILVLSRQTGNLYSKKSSAYPLCKGCGGIAPADGRCKGVMKKPDEMLLNSTRGVQILAATPGSGSAWCRITVGYITGSRKTNLSAIYSKTHFPYQKSAAYLNSLQNRTMVLIRDPFDAGFSEYTRGHVRATTEQQKSKYDGIEKLSLNDYLNRTQRDTPSAGFSRWITKYFWRWRTFHEYWLSTYTGNVEVVLYQDLVDDISKFTEITNYFGYNATLTKERRLRLACFYQRAAKINTRKRPHSEVAHTAKKVLRNFYRSDIDEERAYVEELLKEKYKRTIIISK